MVARELTRQARFAAHLAEGNDLSTAMARVREDMIEFEADVAGTVQFEYVTATAMIIIINLHSLGHDRVRGRCGRSSA